MRLRPNFLFHDQAGPAAYVATLSHSAIPVLSSSSLRSTASYAIAYVDYSDAEMAPPEEFEIAS
jgi:hypothetical protein